MMSSKVLIVGGITLVIILALGWRYYEIGAHRAIMERRLMETPPSQVQSHADLIRFATAQAKPLFAENCAACHGADLKGNTAIGAPDLIDGSWLYGSRVDQIERTILYGVRSGLSKSRDVTEMPADGQRGRLTSGQISDVIQYLLKLGNRPHDELAAIAGKSVYNGTGECFDCHSGDGKGDSENGVPDLTGGSWLYGGSPAEMYKSIYFGRHGTMPAWQGRLTLEQIRALAVFIHTASRQ